MPDIDRKFLRLDGVQHQTGCADAIGHPCDCGAEMRHALKLLVDRFDDPVEGVGEDALVYPPDAEWNLDIPCVAIRAARQALANQRARAA